MSKDPQIRSRTYSKYFGEIFKQLKSVKSYLFQEFLAEYAGLVQAVLNVNIKVCQSEQEQIQNYSEGGQLIKGALINLGYLIDVAPALSLEVTEKGRCISNGGCKTRYRVANGSDCSQLLPKSATKSETQRTRMNVISNMVLCEKFYGMLIGD